MRSQYRLGAVFWLVSIEFLLAQFITQTAIQNYSLAEMDISLLGATVCGGADVVAGRQGCSPLHGLFNLGAILNGALVILGVWYTRRLWLPSAFTTTALWLLAVGGGGGIALVGLFPVDVSPAIHVAGAVLALFVPCFGMVLLAGLHWYDRPGFAVYTAATASISFVALILYGLEIYLGLGRGAMERIMSWPHTVWYPITGTLILAGYFKPSAS